MRVLILLLLIVSCVANPLHTAEYELIKIDGNFAKMSKEKGATVAFDKYLADKTEFISQGKLPMTDRQKIIEYFGFAKSLEWKPLKAVVSKSNDLGYTYGVSKMIYNDGNKDVTEYYQYISIWQKDKKGDWKMISDTGHAYPENEGMKYFKN